MKISLLFLLLPAFFISCVNVKEKEVFDKPAILRSREQINFLREKLKSGEFGWKCLYKPGKTETGYYQFLFRFLNDMEVEIASDLSGEDLRFHKSEYAILPGSTTKLSFATRGIIHKLSEYSYDGLESNESIGLKGDFEFLYYGETGKGDIIFKTNRTQETLIFTKATANSVNDLFASYGNLAKFTIKSMFELILKSKDGNEIRTNAYFPPHDARVIIIREIPKDDDGGTAETLEREYLTGYGVRPEGIFLDSILCANGEVVKNLVLTYTENEDRFSTTLKDGTQVAFGE